MKRELGDGFELDDDRGADRRRRSPPLHLAGVYWAAGRPLEVQERLVREAARVVGLYHDGRQIGFCRAVRPTA